MQERCTKINTEAMLFNAGMRCLGRHLSRCAHFSVLKLRGEQPVHFTTAIQRKITSLVGKGGSSESECHLQWRVYEGGGCGAGSKRRK